MKGLIFDALLDPVVPSSSHRHAELLWLDYSLIRTDQTPTICKRRDVTLRVKGEPVWRNKVDEEICIYYFYLFIRATDTFFLHHVTKKNYVFWRKIYLEETWKWHIQKFPTTHAQTRFISV